jgi:hypothetical protein
LQLFLTKYSLNEEINKLHSICYRNVSTNALGTLVVSVGFTDHNLEATHLDEMGFDSRQKQEYIFLFSRVFRVAQGFIKPVLIAGQGSFHGSKAARA